jgi:hypothetical protein
MLLLATTVTPQPLFSQNYGQIRALQRRATIVVQRKNDFVARVLQSYKIPYQRTEEGVVHRLQMGGRWLDVNQIEIVPLVREEDGAPELLGHEIYFYTEKEILHLVSAITIR